MSLSETTKYAQQDKTSDLVEIATSRHSTLTHLLWGIAKDFFSRTTTHYAAITSQHSLTCKNFVLMSELSCALILTLESND